MKYICDICNYQTEYSSNWCIHKKGKKHRINESKLVDPTVTQTHPIKPVNNPIKPLNNPNINFNNDVKNDTKDFICIYCKKKFK